MPRASRIAAFGALAALLTAGGTAVALSNTDDTATCSAAPTVTRTGSSADIDIHCTVPNTVTTETVTVPGPTQTVTATVTVTAAPQAATLFGGSVPNPGGESSAAAAATTSKLGAGAVVRQFHGSTLTWTTPPAGSLIWASYKPPTTVTDAQIDALLTAARGHYVTFWHEPDNDGLTATARTARIALMNRLYDRNVALGRPATVVPIFTGGFFADYGTQANRDLWASVKGDLIGIDADGVHDSTGPTYDMTYADEVANVVRWLDAHPAYRGWAVGEFGTSRQAFDVDGTVRRDWMKAQVGIFISAKVKPSAVAWYDYDTSAHNGATTNYNRLADPSPELTYWRALVSLN